MVYTISIRIFLKTDKLAEKTVVPKSNVLRSLLFLNPINDVQFYSPLHIFNLFGDYTSLIYIKSLQILKLTLIINYLKS